MHEIIHLYRPIPLGGQEPGYRAVDPARIGKVPVCLCQYRIYQRIVQWLVYHRRMRNQWDASIMPDAMDGPCRPVKVIVQDR
jgi:hypothetical protein